MNNLKNIILLITLITIGACSEDTNPEHLDLLLFNEQEAGVALVYIKTDIDNPVDIYLDDELQGSLTKKYNGVPDISTQSENCLKLYLSHGIYNLNAKQLGKIINSKTININQDVLLVPISDSTIENEVPVVETLSITKISVNSVKTGGNVISNGGSEVFLRGVCWSKNEFPTINNDTTINGKGLGEFESNIINIESNITYYARAYASNINSTSYGNQLSFICSTISDTLPNISIIQINDITSSSANIEGNINSIGESIISNYGFCWSASQHPTIIDSSINLGTTNKTGSIYGELTDLSENTTYYVRAYATNASGTSYSSQINFTTTTDIDGTVTDIDGNVYKWVLINNQKWMAEDLKVSHFPNGEIIPLVTSSSEWGDLEDNNSDAAYCYYYNESNIEFGALYTHAAANNACPEGWHLPSDDEWKQLEIFIGMSQVDADDTGWRGIDEGRKLKSAKSWNYEEYSYGTDDYGFAALPGGSRGDNQFGSFINQRVEGFYWTSSDYSETKACTRMLKSYYSYIGRLYKNKSAGYSVRCVEN
jgi:uncharacterized protein (TIGR02145 family)